MSSSFAPPAAEQSFDGAAGPSGGGGTSAVVPVAQFREIHKNTWLKRLTADGKKVTVGPKKSDRTWVVFCVHDDTEALLEGYAEPRQAGSHSPEWMVRLQDTLHISHALIPNSHEFEFVVTLSNEVMRFHAMSWEIMQEWVETLRSKLREMKILSPRENLYTKLPEIRAPLLPTRDPTSPLPAPPPVPAALVPGTEIVTNVAASSVNGSSSTTQPPEDESSENAATTSRTHTPSTSSTNPQQPASSLPPTSSPAVDQPAPSSVSAPPASLFTAMSNTLSQNLLNMLSDPISAYSEQLHGDEEDDDDDEADDSDDDDDEPSSAGLLKHSNLLRGGLENSVRLDVPHEHRMSADHLKNLSSLFQCDRRIPRPQTSRSLSAGAADKSRIPKPSVATKPSKKPPQLSAELRDSSSSSNSNNITELEVAPAAVATSTSGTSKTHVVGEEDSGIGEAKSNITIIQVSESGDAETEASAPPPPKLPLKTITGDIFKFPDTDTPSTSSSTSIKLSKPSASAQVEYKSNVQIIPSNANSSTIQVLGGGGDCSSAAVGHVSTTVANQYSSPLKKVTASGEQQQQHSVNSVTSVHCPGESTTTTSSTTSSAISVYGTCYNNGPGTCYNNGPGPVADEGTPKMPKKIILSANTSGVTNISVNNDVTASTTGAAGSSKLAIRAAAPPNGISTPVKHYEKVFLSSNISSNIAVTGGSEATTTSSGGMNSAASEITPSTTTTTNSPKWNGSRRNEPKVKATPRPTANERLTSPSSRASPAALPQPPLPSRPPFLTRGLTEAVISTRPSRKDFHFLKLAPAKTKSQSGNNAKTPAAVQHSGPNNNAEGGAASHAPVNRTNSDCLEHRRRSSSTSDARNGRSASSNNNEHHPGRNYGMAGGGGQPGVLRIQQPPHVAGGTGAPGGPTTNSSPSTKRMTLREQQVMQLRREIMHPGGVRLQLRRKDCIGSIAWVDAFGAVWVAGWKQKECPVLYNALHIGDQLLSIAGVTVSSATEANKIIRNSNTLFVEMLVRRIPFGRGYAIRRDREGQCLGLIRDGNTATIVDVVPNSLAARHGLPPKAQSCDGASLTFWVMTEINGRPLNLFFKDNEIRDRLNSVGRDISILVQPADLIAKLKKQLKSLRGYKDYLVQ